MRTKLDPPLDLFCPYSIRLRNTRIRPKVFGANGICNIGYIQGFGAGLFWDGSGNIQPGAGSRAKVTAPASAKYPGGSGSETLVTTVLRFEKIVYVLLKNS